MSSIVDAIGNTPLVRLRKIVPANGAELWVKLEYLNPTGSMKDRMALAMIEGAERDGLLEPGMTVVEYTGGSTGPALALVCRAKGYRPLIVMADCYSEERFALLDALGAEIDVVKSVEGRPRVTAQDIQNMIARAGELAQQSGGRVTAVVQGLGTATSLLGISEALRPRGVHIQALEPAGSAAIGGGGSGSFAMQGWAGFVMPQWDPERVDGLEAIEDDEAIAMTLRLAREEGIFAGVSTGANVVGALRLAERLGPESVIVTLAVDTGFKYLSVSPYADL